MLHTALIETFFEYQIMIDIFINIVVVSVILTLYHFTSKKLDSFLATEFYRPRDKKQHRVLSVIANHDLNQTGIESSLYDASLDVILLPIKQATQEKIINELNNGTTILSIESHGLNGSFKLQDTSIPTSWLGRVINNTHIECCLLLFCNSYTDQEIFQGKTTTIGLIGDIEDETVILFTRHFYFYVSRGWDYKEAYERARLFLHPKDFNKFVFQYKK